MRGTMMSTPLTVSILIERAGRYFPDVEVVSRQPDKSLHRTTWRDVQRRSRALAESLLRSGLRRGDRVATLMWNHAPEMWQTMQRLWSVTNPWSTTYTSMQQPLETGEIWIAWDHQARLKDALADSARFLAVPAPSGPVTRV